MGERVKSKNLFNFKPQGFIDEDIVAFDLKMKTEYNIDPDVIEERMQKLSEAEFVAELREMMNGYMGATSFSNAPVVIEAYESCNHQEIKVATSHDGEYEVKVLVHTPKKLVGVTKRACIVYAHGGGVIGCSAQLHSRYLAHMAVDCNVVVFNVDYRLAPETRCPNNVLDFYEALKYVVGHSSELGVDPARICIAGESGGGYICAGTMVQLALKEEAGLVKVAIPAIAMIDDYDFNARESMTAEEREYAGNMQRTWRAIAGPDFEQKRTDPLLFPAKASEELLRKMPPTIVWEEEFDMFITPASRFAAKLRAAGRLLELVIIPGAKHAMGMMPDFKVWKLEREAWRKAIEEYLVKD